VHRKPTGPAPITTTGRPAEPVGLPDVSGACSGVALPGVDVSSAGLLGWQTQPLDPAGPVPQHWAFAAASQQLTCSAGAQHPLTVPRSGPAWLSSLLIFQYIDYAMRAFVCGCRGLWLACCGDRSSAR